MELLFSKRLCYVMLCQVENKIKRRGGGGPPSPTLAAAVEISSPTVIDEAAMRARMDALRCVELAASSCPAPPPPVTAVRGHSAPSTPTAERGSLDAAALSSDASSVQRRRRQRSLDSTDRVSVYDNVHHVTAVDDDPQRQLDVILSALYRDIGMLSTSLAVVNEEHLHGHYTPHCFPQPQALNGNVWDLVEGSGRSRGWL